VVEALNSLDQIAKAITETSETVLTMQSLAAEDD